MLYIAERVTKYCRDFFIVEGMQQLNKNIMNTNVFEILF